MDHFAVVQSIVRAALSGDRGAVGKQVSRLRERLEKAGDLKDAATLQRLLDAVDETKDIAPSRVEVSRTLVSGERLAPDVNPPIDRETGARLCTITFGRCDAQAPIYGAALHETIDGLLQEWSNAAALQSVGVEPTRTLLIYGPPGSGKTVTAHYISQRLGLPLVTHASTA